MFHPLAEDPSKIKDQELESKILDLTKKYHIAARMGQGGICSQIVVVLDMYKTEQYKRQQNSIHDTMKKQNKSVDDLINVE